MSLSLLESLIRQVGALLAWAVLVILLNGIRRGFRRRPGRTSGQIGVLRSPSFYLVASALFFGLAWIGWRPLPLVVAPSVHLWMIAVGSLLYFPGILLVLWGRLALGANYFVSTALGAQLFPNHQLVTSGPYALVRHPMYAGLMLAAWGSLLIYVTWTSLLFTIFAPLIIFRALREEQALAAEFGEQWKEYCQRVQAFLPGRRR